MIHLAGPLIGAEERQAVDRVLRSGMIAQGPEVAAFEQEFAAFCGADLAIAVNSGTAALHLGLLAAGIGVGDEVIVPSFTFAATANAVALTGAVPVFVDIDPESYTIAPDAVEAAVTSATAAVLPVHLYGLAADIGALRSICARHGLALFEDAAQAHGATWGSATVGSFGEFAAFSFYPTKNMTTGEGGMITTSDPALARRARLLRNQGMERRYHNEVVGFNARMTDIAAAIGRVQLGRLPGWIDARRAVARTYDAALAHPCSQPDGPDRRHVYHQYTIRPDDRDDLVGRLDAAGIGYGVYYPTPVHTLPSFDVETALPATTAAAATVLSIPIRPDLQDSDVQRIIDVVGAA